MAYITIETETDGGVRTLHESLSRDDLDSKVFCGHLVERLQWAVEDTAPAAREPPAAAATLTGGVLDALDPRRIRAPVAGARVASR